MGLRSRIRQTKRNFSNTIAGATSSDAAVRKSTRKGLAADVGMGALDVATIGVSAFTGKSMSDMVGYESKTGIGKSIDTATDTVADVTATAAPIIAGVATTALTGNPMLGKAAMSGMQAIQGATGAMEDEGSNSLINPNAAKGFQDAGVAILGATGFPAQKQGLNGQIDDVNSQGEIYNPPTMEQYAQDQTMMAAYGGQLAQGGWLDKYTPNPVNPNRFLKKNFQAGGNVKPYITTNPNDSRIQQYNDSLALYNYGKDGEKVYDNLVEEFGVDVANDKWADYQDTVSFPLDLFLSREPDSIIRPALGDRVRINQWDKPKQKVILKSKEKKVDMVPMAKLSANLNQPTTELQDSSWQNKLVMGTNGKREPAYMYQKRKGLSNAQMLKTFPSLVQKQNGGPIKPYQAINMADYNERSQMYNDSLSAYNDTQSFLYDTQLIQDKGNIQKLYDRHDVFVDKIKEHEKLLGKSYKNESIDRTFSNNLGDSYYSFHFPSRPKPKQEVLKPELVTNLSSDWSRKLVMGTNGKYTTAENYMKTKGLNKEQMLKTFPSLTKDYQVSEERQKLDVSRMQSYQNGGVLPKYETTLSSEEEAGFTPWLDTQYNAGNITKGDFNFYKKNNYGYNYDYRAAYKKGEVAKINPVDNEYHWSDIGKKPNHPTFSNESKYHNVDGNIGGSWDGENFIPAYVAPDLLEVEITPEGTALKDQPKELEAYYRDYAAQYPREAYIQFRKENPIGREKIKAINSKKWNDYIEKQANKEYKDRIRNYAGEQLVKENPQENRNRKEYLKSFTEQELATIKNSKSKGKVNPTIWQKFEGALKQSASAGAPGDLRYKNVETNSLTNEEIKDVGALDLLGPLSIPSKLVQSGYKDGYSFLDALKGQENDATIIEDVATDPLNLIGLGLVSKGAKSSTLLKAYKNLAKLNNSERANTFKNIYKSEIITPEGFQNRVFDSNIQLGTFSNKGHLSEKGFNYRTLSERELEAIQKSKGVFPKEGKAKGGNENVKYWTKGNEKNWYADNPNQQVIRVRENKINTDKVVNANDVEFFNHQTGKFEPINNYKSFKSEIDWGKWNKEIPENKALMQEYNAIEQQAKADGSWMKNPDGSEFKGTPEQFIQQNSENFKKAYPNSYKKVFRGMNSDNPLLLEKKGYTGVFTGNKDLAKGYGNHLSELAMKNSDNSVTFNALKDDWLDLNFANRTIESQTKNIKFNKKHLEKLKAKNANPAIIESTTKNIEQLENGLNQTIKANQNPHYKKMVDHFKGQPEVSTDDIATYLEKQGLDNVQIKNVLDGDFGDINISNQVSGNYLKSLIGNNGMFDMTNPNIYKTLVPIGLGLGAAGTAMSQEKAMGGTLDKSVMGYRDDSPYKNEPFIDINTPTGEIDMSKTGVSLYANGKLLKPYSGKHKFNTTKVREIPVSNSWLDKYN